MSNDKMSKIPGTAAFIKANLGRTKKGEHGVDHDKKDEANDKAKEKVAAYKEAIMEKAAEDMQASQEEEKAE